MKLFKQSLLVAAILAGLSACSEEDYSPQEKLNENAPSHGGNINVTVSENDDFQFLYMLGTPTGAKSGDGVAVDLDGNTLSVSDVEVVADDATGIELGDLKVGVRPQLLKDQLDTGDTRTVTINYKVTDGSNEVDRSMIINIEGVDYAPEVQGDLTANFTKDSASAEVDLLASASDADGEVLTVANLVADANNPFELPVTVTDGILTVDIVSVKDQIPDGSKLTFNYTYDVKDHNHNIARALSINILGVKDVAGAPLFAEYFLTAEVNETDNATTYDLIQGAVDREGDVIVVKDLKLDGSNELPFAAELKGTDLKFYPTAYLTEIQAGKSKTLEFSYKVADENGNESDGERTLTIKVNGVESNLVALSGAKPGFEGLAEGAMTTSSGWSKFGWENTTQPMVSKASAHSGENGIYLDKGVGLNLNWSAQADRVYYYSSWFKTDVHTAHSVWHNVLAQGANWWVGGTRPWTADSSKWTETNKVFHTFDGGIALYPNASMQIFNGPAASNSDTGAHVDDIRIVDVTELDAQLNNLLANEAGQFEGGDLPQNNGEGNIQLTDDSAYISSGQQALSVDTAQKAGYSVDVILPVKAGAIKAGGRYMVQLDIQATNAAENVSHNAFEVSLQTANGNVLAFGQVWGNVKNDAVRLVLNTETATGTPDWQTEDVNLRLLFKLENTQFYVDDVAIFAIP
ncbi:hypothetical protein [Gayadomonas joobiniege]|uniref:hypothetical protein n=1 Tax=Gayadomonas joobiniege TaxID=1234606 RepID=UPI00036786FE|nr:hypothetical protein [Gayadomonas joobiniege]